MSTDSSCNLSSQRHVHSPQPSLAKRSPSIHRSDNSSTDSDTNLQSRPSRSGKVRRKITRGLYQVNPPSHPSSSQCMSVPREPSTSSASDSSSSATSSPSEASFDLSKDFSQSLVLDTGDKPNILQLSIQQQIQASKCNSRKSSTFWDLITDVARDLDLKIQDLSPDSEILQDNKKKFNHQQHVTSVIRQCSAIRSTPSATASTKADQNPYKPSFDGLNGHQPSKTLDRESLPGSTFCRTPSVATPTSSYDLSESKIDSQDEFKKWTKNDQIALKCIPMFQSGSKKATAVGRGCKSIERTSTNDDKSVFDCHTQQSDNDSCGISNVANNQMPPQISAWIPKHNDSSGTSAAKRITTVDYGLEHKGVPRQSSCQSGMPALNRSINLRCESVILSNGKLAASTSALPTLANISSSQPANARHETWKSVLMPNDGLLVKVIGSSDSNNKFARMTDLPEGNVDNDDEGQSEEKEDAAVMQWDHANVNVVEVNFKSKINNEDSEDSAADVSYERGSDIEGSENEDGADFDSNEALIAFKQRIRISQPIWYLPHINRATVVHYLQGKNVGVFIVRQSSKENTLALSVRLPQGCGPHVEHYLIEKGQSSSNSKNYSLHLEGSEHYFENIQALVTHYCQCCDELPVQLGLCPVLMTSSSSQIASLAVLGQEFWQSKFVSLKYLPKNSLNTESLALVHNKNLSEESVMISELKEDPPMVPQSRKPQRHDSNSSESTVSKSSLSSQKPLSLTRHKSTDVFPLDTPDVRQPPLPPKLEIHPMIDSKKSSIVFSDNSKQPLIDIQQVTSKVSKSSKPKLPSRHSNQPPPIPPRIRHGGSPDLNQICTFISPTVDHRPRTTIGSNMLNELLSPVSMTESEIELAKMSLSINSQHEQKPLLISKSNYYNHVTVEPMADKKMAPTGSKVSEVAIKSVKSLERYNVYTQTYHNHNGTSVKCPESVQQMSSSCFYMDPIDAIPVLSRRQIKRHSDPELNSQGEGGVSIIDYQNSFNAHSSLGHSLESLLGNLKNRLSTIGNTGESTASRLRKKDKERQSLSQSDTVPTRADVGFSTIDSAWQWHDCSNDTSSTSEHKSSHSKRSSVSNKSIKSDKSAAGEETMSSQVVIATRTQEINNNNTKAISMFEPDERTVQCSKIEPGLIGVGTDDQIGNATDYGIEFSDPWNREASEDMVLLELVPQLGDAENDSLLIESHLHSTHKLLNNDLINFNSFLLNQEQYEPNGSNSDYDNVAYDDDYGQYEDNRGNEDKLPSKNNVAVSRDRNKEPTSSDGIMLNIVYNVSNHVFELANQQSNVFSKSIENFIECTKESTESNPIVILGYIRQFMNGMKNYLIKHGEGQFIQTVQNERGRLKPNQFLNIDSILEAALQKLIIKPLKSYIYELFIKHYTESGNLKLLSRNIRLAQEKSPQEYGVVEGMLPLPTDAMLNMQQNMHNLCQSYSPIKKLEYLLKSISTLSESYEKRKFQSRDCSHPLIQQSKREFNRSLSGDQLLPMLVYVIVQCGLITAEFEVEYMLGLLHPQILNGDGSYYLILLSSAVQVLKAMFHSSIGLEDRQLALPSNQPSQKVVNKMFSESSPKPLAMAYLKIMFPDEGSSNITCKTVPVRNNMTTKEVCRMLAHTFRITNHEDYCLYRIKQNGIEDIQLMDHECPQFIKSQMMEKGESAMFAYKRCDAKFVWPIASPD